VECETQPAPGKLNLTFLHPLTPESMDVAAFTLAL